MEIAPAEGKKAREKRETRKKKGAPKEEWKRKKKEINESTINCTGLNGSTDYHSGVFSHEAHGEALEEAHWSNTRVHGTSTPGVSENSDYFESFDGHGGPTPERFDC